MGKKAADRIALMERLGKAVILSGEYSSTRKHPPTHETRLLRGDLDLSLSTVARPATGPVLPCDEGRDDVLAGRRRTRGRRVTRGHARLRDQATDSAPPTSHNGRCDARQGGSTLSIDRDDMSSPPSSKELPLRGGALLSVFRRGRACIADTANYSIIDLDAAIALPLLPISQTPNTDPRPLSTSSTAAVPPTGPDPRQRPAISCIGKDEFLLASHTGSTTLGVFVNESGEPCRGTLEWGSNLRSLSESASPPRMIHILIRRCSRRPAVRDRTSLQQHDRNSLDPHTRDCATDPTPPLLFATLVRTSDARSFVVGSRSARGHRRPQDRARISRPPHPTFWAVQSQS